MTAASDLETDVYVAPVHVDDVFVDDTYQRVLDVARARKMAANWDRRLAGIIEVSDRGQDEQPRYAVIDGQHRWGAARFLVVPPVLVANIHTGLSVADEAVLFDKLNRQRKQPNTWDHWKARRTAGDETVLAIEHCVASHGLLVSEQTTKDGAVWCIGTLEKIATSAGGLDLLNAALAMLRSVWGDQRDAFEAPLVGGMALLLYTFGELIDADRLYDALVELQPRRIRYIADGLKETERGSMMKLTAIVMKRRYDGKPGRNLVWPIKWSGALPKARAEKQSTVNLAPDIDWLAVDFVCEGSDMPLNQAERAEVVRRWTVGGRSASCIAERLGITDRTVQRIRTDLGLVEPRQEITSA